MGITTAIRGEEQFSVGYNVRNYYGADTIDRVSGEGADWESRERGLVGRNKEILSGKNRDGCRPG